MRKEIIVGNLNCIFIGAKSKFDLLDRWDEYVKTVFSENYTFGNRPQKILKHIRYVTLASQEPAIVGRIVKNTILRVEQTLEENELVPKDESYDSAPSSVFIYLLKTHTLIFMAENPGAPHIRSFKRFLEISINKERKRFIKAAGRDMTPEKKLVLIDNNPPMVASYIPIPMVSTLESEFSKLLKISRLKVRHYYQNSNVDVSSWIDGDNAILAALKAPKIDHIVTKVDDIEGAKAFVMNLSSASESSFQIDGTSEDGHMKISNLGVQYSSYVPSYNNNEDILQVAEKAFDVYLVDRKKGAIPTIAQRNSDEKIAVVFKNERK